MVKSRPLFVFFLFSKEQFFRKNCRLHGIRTRIDNYKGNIPIIRPLPLPFICIIVVRFQTVFYKKTEDLIGIRTRIVEGEGEHADH